MLVTCDVMAWSDLVDVQISTDPDRSQLSWLPQVLAEHCKLVVTCTRDEELQSDSQDYTHHYNVLATRLDNPMLVIHLGHLGPELALTVRSSHSSDGDWLHLRPCQVITDLMRQQNRKLGNFQKRLVLNSLEHCSLPLFCKLIFAEVSRWRSFSSPRETHLADNVTDCISLLFQKVESKHGWFMVAHSLAYVTAAKNGITESEIEDLISLGIKERYYKLYRRSKESFNVITT